MSKGYIVSTYILFMKIIMMIVWVNKINLNQLPNPLMVHSKVYMKTALIPYEPEFVLKPQSVFLDISDVLDSQGSRIWSVDYKKENVCRL